MIHSSNYKPRIFPMSADLEPANLDRIQDISINTALNRERIKEVGTDGAIAWKSAIPTVSVTLRQLEYGSMSLWRNLANKGASVTSIAFTDFKTPQYDIAGYKTDDNGTFLGTLYFSDLRTSGFSINFGAPDALIERNITCVGEKEKILQEDNKYLIHKRFVMGAGVNQTCTISDPTPQPDPDNSGEYLFKVVRVRSATATTLTHGTDWSYDGVSALTINGTSQAGDIIKVWYSGSAYITGESIFTSNTSDLYSIDCDSISIYLASTNYLYKLQSANVEVNFDRFDVSELGNDEKVTYGIRDVNTRVTLGKVLESWTMEEVARGQAGLSPGIIDMSKLTDNLTLTVKIFENEDKTNFKLGYAFTDLATTSMDTTIPTSDYVQRGATFEGSTGFIRSENNF